jgi:hypothetical protein
VTRASYSVLTWVTLARKIIRSSFASCRVLGMSAFE